MGAVLLGISWWFRLKKEWAEQAKNHVGLLFPFLHEPKQEPQINNDIHDGAPDKMDEGM